MSRLIVRLRDCFEEWGFSVVLSPAAAESGQHPGAIVRELDWIHRRSVSNLAVVTALQVELDAGEAEAIALAQELAADLLLIDEHLGRVAAAQLGIRMLEAPAIRPRLHMLQHHPQLPIQEPLSEM